MSDTGDPTMDAAKKLIADRITVLGQLAAGIASFQAALAAATADIPAAQARKAATVTLQGQVASLDGQVAAWSPVSAGVPELLLIRGVLKTVLDNQGLILGALAEMYDYRVAVDGNAALTDTGILWLANQFLT